MSDNVEQRFETNIRTYIHIPYNEEVEEVRLIEEGRKKERKKGRSASQALTQVIQYSRNC